MVLVPEVLVAPEVLAREVVRASKAPAVRVVQAVVVKVVREPPAAGLRSKAPAAMGGPQPRTRFSSVSPLQPS